MEKRSEWFFFNFRQPPNTLHIHSSDRERTWPEAHCHVCDCRAFSTMACRWSEIGSMTSLDARNSDVSSDAREPISLHQTVLEWKWTEWAGVHQYQLVNGYFSDLNGSATVTKQEYHDTLAVSHSFSVSGHCSWKYGCWQCPICCTCVTVTACCTGISSRIPFRLTLAFFVLPELLPHHNVDHSGRSWGRVQNFYLLGSSIIAYVFSNPKYWIGTDMGGWVSLRKFRWRIENLYTESHVYQSRSPCRTHSVASAAVKATAPVLVFGWPERMQNGDDQNDSLRKTENNVKYPFSNNSGNPT